VPAGPLNGHRSVLAPPLACATPYLGRPGDLPWASRAPGAAGATEGERSPPPLVFRRAVPGTGSL